MVSLVYIFTKKVHLVLSWISKKMTLNFIYSFLSLLLSKNQFLSTNISVSLYRNPLNLSRGKCYSNFAAMLQYVAQKKEKIFACWRLIIPCTVKLQQNDMKKKWTYKVIFHMFYIKRGSSYYVSFILITNTFGSKGAIWALFGVKLYILNCYKTVFHM